METYKELLLTKLINNGWESILDEESSSFWWASEHWMITSNRNNLGLKLFIHFLVDPSYDGQDKDKNVWAICVTEEMPVQREIAEKTSKSLVSLSKGKVKERINKLINDINNYRNSI